MDFLWNSFFNKKAWEGASKIKKCKNIDNKRSLETEYKSLRNQIVISFRISKKEFYKEYFLIIQETRKKLGNELEN